MELPAPPLAQADLLVLGAAPQAVEGAHKRSANRPTVVVATAMRTALAGASTANLLQTLFPNGLPARQELIRRANERLDEAEKLAKAGRGLV